MNLYIFLIFITIPVYVLALGTAKAPKHSININANTQMIESAFANHSANNVDTTTRFVGGEVAHIPEFPWISVVWAFPPGDVLPLTNAAIINKYFAVTTYHGLFAVSGPDVQYALAFNSDTSGPLDTILRSIKEIITHDDYQGGFQYDIVLVRVCTSIPSKFTRVNLAPSSSMYTNGDEATYVAHSLGLKKGTKLVTEWCECERYADWTMDQHLCVECSSDLYTTIGTAEFGTVVVVINGEVAGLMLKSSSDCDHNYGEMALNLARFRDWIDEKAVYDESM